MVELAQKQLPNSIIHLADGRTCKPTPSDLQYDCIVSYHAFLISFSNADTKAVFPRMYKWLRPGRMFVFGSLAVEGEQDQTNWPGRDVVSSTLAADELNEGVRRAGLTIEGEEKSAFTPEKAVDAGLCGKEDVWEEDHAILFCRKVEEFIWPPSTST